MILFRLALSLGAFFCCVRAVGYWVILQVGSVRSVDRSSIATVVWVSVLLFVALCSGSAYLKDRTRGLRATLCDTLFFAGVHGLPAIAIFAVASKGDVFRLPEVVVLAVMFGCFILVRGYALAGRTTRT
jgi:hypothetical protein